MRPRRASLGLLGLVAVVFLLWRFLRPLTIFVVADTYALPIPTTTPYPAGPITARGCGACHAEFYEDLVDDHPRPSRLGLAQAVRSKFHAPITTAAVYRPPSHLPPRCGGRQGGGRFMRRGSPAGR